MIKNIATTILIVLFALLSIYLIWGWLTVNDICTWSSKQGLDSDKVLSSLIWDPDSKISQDPNGRIDFSIKSRPGEHYNISRLALSFLALKGGDKNISAMCGGVLEPFLFLSPNVNKLFCCFGIGYMTGLLVVGIEFLKKNESTQSRLVFRPLIGALASCLLFIVIISGGAVIWNEVAGINGLSLGMIGVIGSLFCEKIKLLITSI